MDELVERLSQGQHPVEFTARPEKTVGVLKECLDRGYVHVKFTGTRGGTELGFPVDTHATDMSRGDFTNSTGRITVAGDLILNDVKVKCVANLDLATLEGTGHLQPL